VATRARRGLRDRREEIRDLLEDAGLGKVTVRIGIVEARFPSAAMFLRAQVASSPLAGPVGALDPDRYAALSRDLTQAPAEYEDDVGIAFPLQTWLATAYR
jgi:hypothetical protein